MIAYAPAALGRMLARTARMIPVAHVAIGGTARYFSTETFRYCAPGVDVLYEGYLQGVDRVDSAANPFDQIPNSNTLLVFRNRPFGAYDSLIDFFQANEIARSLVEICELWVDPARETFSLSFSRAFYSPL